MPTDTSRCLAHGRGMKPVVLGVVGDPEKHMRGWLWAGLSEDGEEPRRWGWIPRVNLHPRWRHRENLDNHYFAISRRGIVHICQCRWDGVYTEEEKERIADLERKLEAIREYDKRNPYCPTCSYQPCQCERLKREKEAAL